MLNKNHKIYSTFPLEIGTSKAPILHFQQPRMHLLLGKECRYKQAVMLRSHSEIKLYQI